MVVVGGLGGEGPAAKQDTRSEIGGDEGWFPARMKLWSRETSVSEEARHTSGRGVEGYAEGTQPS
jgi:hypothetical protein